MVVGGHRLARGHDDALAADRCVRYKRQNARNRYDNNPHGRIVTMFYAKDGKAILPASTRRNGGSWFARNFVGDIHCFGVRHNWLKMCNDAIK
jgi:hypothetical protein